MNIQRRLGRFKRQTAIGYSMAVRLQKSWRRRAVTSSTEIVIDGFPRSGNTYSTVAFLIAQGRTVSVAHHLHSPYQAVRAESLGIPCLIVIRNPLDSVASLLVTQPWRTRRQALLEYGDFYGQVNDWPVVANFEQITSNFSEVVARVNGRFGTDFSLPAVNSTESDRRVFDTINVLTSMLFTGDTATRIARPTVAREDELAMHREGLASLTIARDIAAFHRAMATYRRLTQTAAG